MQKKLNRKLVLSKETLRTLSNLGLNHVQGGATRFCTTSGSTPTEDACVSVDGFCPSGQLSCEC
jgi:hypothetical protein